MRLINLDDILKKFPKSDFDGDDLENMKAYPHWKTDITGLFNILKSVPTIETCEDCISRQAVIDLAITIETDDYSGNEVLEVVEVEEIKKLPSVTPQPKMGRWEYVQYDNNPNIGNWHCSECRGICTEMHSIEDAYNYCPNCGAKMESEE